MYTSPSLNASKRERRKVIEIAEEQNNKRVFSDERYTDRTLPFEHHHVEGNSIGHSRYSKDSAITKTHKPSDRIHRSRSQKSVSSRHSNIIPPHADSGLSLLESVRPKKSQKHNNKSVGNDDFSKEKSSVPFMRAVSRRRDHIRSGHHGEDMNLNGDTQTSGKRPTSSHENDSHNDVRMGVHKIDCNNTCRDAVVSKSVNIEYKPKNRDSFRWYPPSRWCSFTNIITMLCFILSVFFGSYVIYSRYSVTVELLTRTTLETSHSIHRSSAVQISRALSGMVHRAISVRKRITSVLMENDVIYKLNNTKFTESQFYKFSEDESQYAFTMNIMPFRTFKSPIVFSGLDFYTLGNVRRGIELALSTSLHNISSFVETSVNFPGRLLASASSFSVHVDENVFDSPEESKIRHRVTDNYNLNDTYMNETETPVAKTRRREYFFENTTFTKLRKTAKNYGIVSTWVPILQPIKIPILPMSPGIHNRTDDSGAWADLLLIQKCPKISNYLYKESEKELIDVVCKKNQESVPQCVAMNMMYEITFPNAYESMYFKVMKKLAHEGGYEFFPQSHTKLSDFSLTPISNLEPSHWPKDNHSFVVYCNAFEPMATAFTKDMIPMTIPADTHRPFIKSESQSTSFCEIFRYMTLPFDNRGGFVINPFHRIKNTVQPSCDDGKYSYSDSIDIHNRKKNISSSEKKNKLDKMTNHNGTDTSISDSNGKNKFGNNTRNMMIWRLMMTSVQEQWSLLYMTPSGDVRFGYSVAAIGLDSPSVLPTIPETLFWTSSAISLETFKDLLNPSTPRSEIYVVTFSGGVVASTNTLIKFQRTVLPFSELSHGMKYDCIPYTANDRSQNLEGDDEEWLCPPSLSSDLSLYAYLMFEKTAPKVLYWLESNNQLSNYPGITETITGYPDFFGRLFGLFLQQAVVSVDVIRTSSAKRYQNFTSVCDNNAYIESIKELDSYELEMIKKACVQYSVKRTLPWLIITVLPADDIFGDTTNEFLVITVIQLVCSIIVVILLIFVMRCMSNRLMKGVNRVGDMTEDKYLTFILEPTRIRELRSVQMLFVALCDRLRETNIDKGLLTKAKAMLKKKRQLYLTETTHTMSNLEHLLGSEECDGRGLPSCEMSKQETRKTLDIPLKELAKCKNKRDVELLGIGSPYNVFLHTPVTVLHITIEYNIVDASAFILQEMITLVMRTCEKVPGTIFEGVSSEGPKNVDVSAEKPLRKGEYDNSDNIEGIIQHVTHNSISVVFLGYPALRELFPGRFPSPTSVGNDSDRHDESQNDNKVNIRDTVVRAVKVACTLASYTNENSLFRCFGNFYYTIDTDTDSLIDKQSPALAGCSGWMVEPKCVPQQIPSGNHDHNAASANMKTGSTDNSCLRAGEASKLFVRNPERPCASLQEVDGLYTKTATCSKTESPHIVNSSSHTVSPTDYQCSCDNDDVGNNQHSGIKTTVLIDPLIILSSAFTVTEKIGNLQADRLKSVIAITDRVIVYLPGGLLSHAAPVDCVEVYSSYIGPETSLNLNAMTGGHILSTAPNGSVCYARSELEKLKSCYGSDWENKKIKISRSEALQKAIDAYLESSSDDDEHKPLEGMPYERRVMEFKPGTGVGYNTDLSKRSTYSGGYSSLRRLVPQYAASTHVGAAAKMYSRFSDYVGVDEADVMGEECQHEEYLNVHCCGGFSTIRTLVYDFTVLYVRKTDNNNNIGADQGYGKPVLHISHGRLQQFQQAFRMLLAGSYSAAVGFLEELSGALQTALLEHQKLMIKYVKKREEARAALIEITQEKYNDNFNQNVMRDKVSSDNSSIAPDVHGKQISGPNRVLGLIDADIADESTGYYPSTVSTIEGHPQARISHPTVPHDDLCGVSLIETDPVLTVIRLINHVNRWKRIASIRIYSNAPYVRKEGPRYETSKQFAEMTRQKRQ